MIGYLKGTLAWCDDDSVVLDVNGVGYQVGVSRLALEAMPPAGSEVQLYTHLYIREDVLALYGFLSGEELEMFRRLIQVNGIGPKGAMAIFGVLSVSDLKFAILSEDAKAISKAPGVGAKSAQRVIIELKDKVSLEDAFTQRLAQTNASGAQSGEAADAVAALVALGYGVTEATKAVRSIPDQEGMPSDQLVKLALRQLF